MGRKEEYSKELQHDKWLKKKLKILELAKYKCSYCKKSVPLDIHHLYYINGHRAWEYPNKALVALCRHCHQVWHDTHEIEVRKVKWKSNTQYTVPIKPKGSYKKKLEPIVKKEIKLTYNRQHIESVSSKQILTPLEKKKRRLQKKAKEKLFIDAGFKIVGEIRILIKKFTIEEIKEYLIDKI